MGRRREIAGCRMIVTGASQGIGRELALQAAARGAKVLAAARSKQLLDELTVGTTGELRTIVADVTSPTDRQTMLDATVQHFGGLDVLVNNAGIGATGHFAEADEKRLRDIFEVNFFAPAELTRLAVPLLKQGTTPAVVNVSSLVGKRGFPGRSEYSASKFALQGWSEALRAELSLYGIDVLVINPGLTQTNFSKNMLERKSKLQVDHMRGMTSDVAATQSLRAIARGTNEVTLTLPAKLYVFAGRFFPRLVDIIAARRVRRVNRD